MWRALAFVPFSFIFLAPAVGSESGSATPEPTPVASPERPAVVAAQTDDWTAIRAGGDTSAQATWDEKSQRWESGGSTIDTALPQGYPAPTPPGAIELKKYPAVRRAEYNGTAGSANNGFWPLFRHIERNEIAMTAPVEMNYRHGAEGVVRDDWTMSFLYRTPDLHPTGTDAADPRVAVRDAEPLTVVSLGGRGSYEMSRIDKDIATLEAWLLANPEWVQAGQPRALMYNGPTFLVWQKWLEVQIPVERATVPTTADAGSGTGDQAK